MSDQQLIDFPENIAAELEEYVILHKQHVGIVADIEKMEKVREEYHSKMSEKFHNIVRPIKLAINNIPFPFVYRTENNLVVIDREADYSITLQVLPIPINE